jgi:lipopolysaccharide biosynthesis glycosyltransferase
MIPVALCFDNNYADYAAVATYSAWKNSKKDLLFHWVFQTSALSKTRANADFLGSIGIRIELHHLSANPFQHWRENGHIKAAAYLRLLLPDILSEEKVIYLDSDTIVCSEVADLFNVSLDGDAVVAGVRDDLASLNTPIPLAYPDQYLNSGVLVLNLKKMRGDIFPQATEIYRQYYGQIRFADQCILNKYAERKIVLIDKRWNRQIFSQTMTMKNFRSFCARSDLGIIHFVGDVKPWHRWCNPEIQKFWWSYANKCEVEGLAPVEIKTRLQSKSLEKFYLKNFCYLSWVRQKMASLNLHRE